MKKVFGVSVLSAMLIFGQPFMALADETSSKTINFDDVEKIITEQNLAIRMNENERLKTHEGFADLKRTIRELEDDLDDVKDEKDGASDVSQIITLNAEKRALLDALEQAERNQADRPTLEAMADLQASMEDNGEILTGEGLYIRYNQLKVAADSISLSIKTMQDQLTAMQLQESLGLVAHNNLNNLKTQLVDMQTQLAGIEFQKASLERQLKNLINDQENKLIIGSIPESEDFTIEDQEADLAKAVENSYTVKLQESQIVILQAALEREKEDHGMGSNEYRMADYELTNAKLKLAQLKDTLKSNYYTMLDDIAQKQSDLRLELQTLGDKKVALSEAQLRKGLGMISQLELDQAATAYQAQENTVGTKQIELFNEESNYEWFLKGMTSL